MRASLAVVALLVVASNARAAEEAAPPRSRSSTLHLRAHGGFTQGSVESIPARGPSVGLAFGGGPRMPWGSVEAVGELAFDALSTEHGVGVRRLAVSSGLEVAVWRLRLGVGMDVGSAWLERLGGSPVSANDLLLGLHATAGFDLFTIGRFTVSLAGRGNYNAVLPSLGVNGGLRYAF